MKRLSTALAIFAAFLVMMIPTAQASSAQVTEFPFTESIYDSCNGDLVLVNGTLVDSVSIIPGRDGGLTYDHRVWWRDVRTDSSNGLSYTVTSGSIDHVSTKVRNGIETQRSLQASWLRLTPTGGAAGELRVVAIYAFRTNAQGETRTFDHYASSCR